MIRQTITIAFCVIIGIYVLFGIFLALIFRAMAKGKISLLDFVMITLFWPTVIKWSTEKEVEEKKEENTEEGDGTFLQKN